MITSELNKVVSKVLATTNLPAATVADSLAEALRSIHAAVVVAPPGAGKSTLLPLSLLRSHQSGRIVMLEPRRIAARQVAARMAAMLGERVGQTVGYQIRFERKMSAMTRIEVVTEASLPVALLMTPRWTVWTALSLMSSMSAAYSPTSPFAWCVRYAMYCVLTLTLLSCQLPSTPRCYAGSLVLRR